MPNLFFKAAFQEIWARKKSNKPSFTIMPSSLNYAVTTLAVCRGALGGDCKHHESEARLPTWFWDGSSTPWALTFLGYRALIFTAERHNLQRS